MPSDRTTDSLHPSLLLGAWAEAMLSGKRVAVLGDSSTGLAEQIAAASSRRVHAYDPDKRRLATTLARASGEEADVSYASFDDLDGRADAFDAVLIDDLSAFREPAELLGRVRALLSRRGFMLLVSPNPEQQHGSGQLGYYDLYDLVAASFEHVRMLGQAPFVGVAVAEFAAAGEPNVTIDTSLTSGSEEPIKFVVVASDHEISVEPYTLVQGPAEQALGWLGLDVDSGPSEGELEEARARHAATQAALEQLQQRAESNRRLADERKALATQLSAKLSELRVELDQHRRTAMAEREGLQKRAADAERRLRQAEQQLRTERASKEDQIERAAEAHQEDLDLMLDRIAELEDELADKEAQLAMKPPEPAPPEPAPPAPAPPPPPVPAIDEDAVRAYEFQLGELRQAVATARADLDEARKKLRQTDELRKALQTAIAERDAARAQADAVAGRADDPAELSRDIADLEERLRERGQRIQVLQVDLRESERIGRELVHKLGASAIPMVASVADPTDHGDSQARVDALLQRCSQYEADLQHAQWRIAALTKDATPQSDDVGDQQKLEQALSRAHEELASLRRQLMEPNR